MAIQSNFPSIRPSLLLDFANSKRLDPRVTFTRASTATYYDGVTVSKAEENLLLRSQDYSATWTVTNLTPVTGKTAPDATSTATEMTAGAANATITQSVTAIAADYTFSVWIRRVTGTGNVDISAHSGGTWVTQTISGTWARYTVTQTLTAGARTPGIRVVTSGDAIEIWGAQIEQRSAATAYTATTTQAITNYVPQLLTAAANVARFDHNPVTDESLGLLVEESRANLLVRSEEFGSWSTANSPTISANTHIAPDGALTADTLGATATTSYFTLGITFTGDGSKSYSLFLKAGTSAQSNITIRDTTASVSRGSATIVWTAGVPSVTVANGSLEEVQSVGNGWYRIKIIASSVVAANSNNIRVSPDNLNGTGNVVAWGAQAENGAFATSYIPTVASTVTRSADAASMTGTNFSSWYNASEGTVYAEVNPSVLENGAGVSINDETTNNRIRVSLNSTSSQFTVRTSGVDQASLDGGTPVVGVFSKFAAAYKVNDFALSLDAGTVATDTVGTVPVVIRMQIGAESSTLGASRIRKVAYYPARLTNAQLQAITG